MSVLLSDPYVERAVMLLALMETATNLVEHARWNERHRQLIRLHPEVAQVLANDLRVENKIQELREAFAVDERLGDYDDSQQPHARRDR